MNETKNDSLKKERKSMQPGLNRIITGTAETSLTAGAGELEKREKELNMRELKFKAKQLLMQKNLPVDLAEIIRLDDEKTVIFAVDMLSRIAGERRNEEGFKVLDEKKLPEIKEEEKSCDSLRKAFGLM